MKVKAKGIRVHVVFEYDNIPDPDCPQADYITELITSATDQLSDEFNASRCYVSDTTESLWVEE